ncbi:MAG: radical SAM protein [Thermoanaerobaculia bacterium]
MPASNAPTLPHRSAAVAATDPGRAAASPEAVPHVVAWNLTRRCNLACAHCYIAAGPWHGDGDELTLEECRRIAGEIFELNPAPLFILSGGEPLLRDDLEDLARFATGAGATVVVGTNGTRLTAERIASLQEAGVTGVALSVDSLDARYHDRFRHGDNALEDTLAAVERLRQARLDFVIQTTLTPGNRHEVTRVAEWAAEKGAVCFNLYFLVETGRGEGMRSLAPAENDTVLAELVALAERFRGRMLVRSKCQPQIMRHALAHEGGSTLAHYATRCPCGIQYCRITPEGMLTPCPYMPVAAGDLRRQSFGEIWREAPLFADLRGGELGGKCGRCEYRAACGGCRARAWARSGQVLAADDSCAYEPPDSEARPLFELPQRPTYGQRFRPALPWSDAARARLERIPSFVRGVVGQRVERWAADRGLDQVTPELLDRIRAELPVDFSKRLPFFARPE